MKTCTCFWQSCSHFSLDYLYLLLWTMVTFQEKILLLVKCFRRQWPLVTNSERTTVCGADCMLMALQLSMAEVNKQVSILFSMFLVLFTSHTWFPCCTECLGTNLTWLFWSLCCCLLKQGVSEGQVLRGKKIIMIKCTIESGLRKRNCKTDGRMEVLDVYV